MSQQHYAITLKINDKSTVDFLTESTHKLLLATHLRTVITKYKGDSIDHFFEDDPHGRLHLHGTFRARKGIRLNLIKIYGVHIYIRAIPSVQDLDNWRKYCRKQIDDVKTVVEQIEDGEYAFIDKQIEDANK